MHGMHIDSFVKEEQAAAWPLSPVFSTGSIQNQKQGTPKANMLNSKKKGSQMDNFSNNIYPY
jgi:hypothetical protein